MKNLLRKWIFKVPFMRRIPDFYILGSQKAGTTSLAYFLSRHPGIFAPHTKENNFFSYDYFYHQGGIRLAQCFAIPRAFWKSYLLFDATPSYLYYPWVPERIAHHTPNAKLIILLRNPITRAFSAWSMYRDLHQQGGETALLRHLQYANPEIKEGLSTLLRSEPFPSFQEYCQNEIQAIHSGNPAAIEPSIVRRGLYAEQIERYLRFFPREKIHIIEDKALRNHRISVLNDLLTFLNLPPFEWPEVVSNDLHTRTYTDSIQPETFQLLADFYRPHNQRLFDLLGTSFSW